MATSLTPGTLRIIVGPMFAGKTSEIQSVVRRYGCLDKKVLVLTADIDNRYQGSVTAIVNHDRAAVPATAVPVDGLLAVLETPDFATATAIVVDEAQFFVGCLIPFVRAAVDLHGKHVVVVGLDSDSNQNPFGDVLALMAHADSIEKKTALCRSCGDGTPAIFTRKVGSGSGSGGIVAVGGAELYEPVCRRHFNSTASLPSLSAASLSSLSTASLPSLSTASLPLPASRLSSSLWLPPASSKRR